MIDNSKKYSLKGLLVVVPDGLRLGKLNKSFLTNISNKIVNSVRGINRVVLDISSKPPSTIELE